MEPIISRQAVDLIVNIVAVAGPLVGVTVGFLLSRREGFGSAAIWKGALIGLLGLLNWGAWRAYNATTDYIGISTTRNLLTQIAMFAAVGVLIGIVCSALSKKHRQID